MRNSAWIGLAVIGCLVVLSEIGMRQTDADHPVAPSGQLIALTSDLPGNHQQVTVIDPKLRAMSVYHIELATGHIEFRSERHIHYDLQMLSHDNKGVLPEEILSMLESR